MMNASVATLAAAASKLAAAPSSAETRHHRVFVASSTPDGILAYDWNPVNGELTPEGVAAKIDKVAWIAYSPGREYLFATSEVDSFNGKPTGAVASFSVKNGELHLLSEQNSAGMGTCHVALDHTGRVLLSADYSGGSAASFLVTEGRLSPALWTEHYSGRGPNPDRQKSAHAHFASFSPDNRYAYMNDLGGDCIHIYMLNAVTAGMMAAGTYRARPGSGPRTLHFHTNGHTAYCVNELDCSVEVLEWSKADGSLTATSHVDLLPEGYHGPATACDAVISRDGKSVYFANRFNDFIYAFKADPKTGALTPVVRSNCGGKIPRNFVLDPTERWMLVANQSSNLISVFARNRETGALAEEGKSFAAATPMRILF